MSRTKTSTNAGELYTLTGELKSLALRLQAKYLMRGIRYKRAGAPSKAIKENAHCQELAKELLQIVEQYEQRVCKKMQKQFNENRHVQFTIYPNGRR